MDEAGDEGLDANEQVVPVSELKRAELRIKELERALGRKTLDNEILNEALRLAKKKKRILRGNSC